MSTEVKYWQKYCNTSKCITKSIVILLLKKYRYWYRNIFLDKVLVLVLQYINKVLLTFRGF